MKFPTVVLFDRDGQVLVSEPDVQGMKLARERAAYLLSDAYAKSCETTHEQLQTAKVAIFAEGAPTGFDQPCEFDELHRQHLNFRHD